MQRRPQLALIAALACAGGLAVLWLLATQVGRGEWLDSNTLRGFADLSRPRVNPLADAVGSLAHPRPYILLGGALTALALARGRPRSAVAIPFIVLGARFSAEVLKQLLATPRHVDWLSLHDQIQAEAFPSGHATGAMALALCLVLAVPQRWRPVAAAAGGSFAVGVGYSVLTLRWHYPSDVLGGYLLATAWALVAVAALWAAERRWPRRTERKSGPGLGRALAPAALMTLAAGGCVAAAVAVRPAQAFSFAAVHTTFVAGATLIGALGVALATALALALRR